MLSNLLLLSLHLLSIDSAAGSHVFRRSDSTLQGKDTIVQLFEWNWASVASECAFLSSAGYGYVQVSPASEHITGAQWWTDYQPVSYQLTSKRGSRSQFINMVSTCNTAGVGIIVDVVLNHMTAASGIGFAGNSYSKYNYPAVPYTSSNFHYCNGNGQASDISNYYDSYDVQFCELVGLADLAQEQPAVQTIMAAYLNDLLSIGVAGFRIDAAKHIPAANLAAIFKLVNAPFYDTQEVVYGNGETIDPSDYVATGSVIEFRATSTVQSYFSGQPGIASLVTPQPMGSSWGFVASSAANFIMANQDTERGGTSLNYKSPFYYLSAIFMLGFNYGTPTVYSGYNFSDFDAGAPQNSAGYTNAVTCGSSGWRCEHRMPLIANMVAFRNAVGCAPLTNVTKGTSQQIAFGRGSIGFLLINNDVKAWTSVWNTSLPAGTYCDIIHDTTLDPNVCNGPAYVITDSGLLSASVLPGDALALFTPSPTSATNYTCPPPDPAPAPTVVTLTFDVTASTASGEIMRVAGSIPQLGSWTPWQAIPLSQVSSSEWKVTMRLAPGTSFEYKYIKFSSSGSVTWESGSNRVYTVPSNPSLSVTLYGSFGSTSSNTRAVTASPTAATSSSMYSSSASSSSSSPSSLSAVSSSSSASAIVSSSAALSSIVSSSLAVSSAAVSSSSAAVKSSSSVKPSAVASSSATHTSSTPAPASTGATVTFHETASTSVSGTVVKLVGSIKQLGSWAPNSAVPLSKISGSNVWAVTLVLPPNTAFQYKYVKVNGKTIVWESDPNRTYTTLGRGSSTTLTSTFR
ncbi:glycoside hydrolase superfamily [Roridomyces roridus]|uniref:Alpha-amylase n=1 Tax=Roridomyces roridus TaxID=1738132 RepID=A0AAD7BVP8_9AGAR|nr:glycoside hydrolase superfamily [Roridomyces roridus]